MLIFLENLAGGTLIRVGSLIRHCIVEGPVLTSLYFPSSKKHEVFVKFVKEGLSFPAKEALLCKYITTYTAQFSPLLPPAGARQPARLRGA